MKNSITPLPIDWASSVNPSRLAEINRKRQDELEAAQALLRLKQWQKIDERFSVCIGQVLKPWQLVDLATYPVEPLMIIYAIHDTRKAPRPSFYYLRAILTNCVCEGCVTAEGYLQRNVMHREEMKSLYRQIAR